MLLVMHRMELLLLKGENGVGVLERSADDSGDAWCGGVSLAAVIEYVSQPACCESRQII
jgi:hypothetical protein